MRSKKIQLWKSLFHVSYLYCLILFAACKCVNTTSIDNNYGKWLAKVFLLPNIKYLWALLQILASYFNSATTRQSQCVAWHNLLKLLTLQSCCHSMVIRPSYTCTYHRSTDYQLEIPTKPPTLSLFTSGVRSKSASTPKWKPYKQRRPHLRVRLRLRWRRGTLGEPVHAVRVTIGRRAVQGVQCDRVRLWSNWFG